MQCTGVKIMVTRVHLVTRLRKD